MPGGYRYKQPQISQGLVLEEVGKEKYEEEDEEEDRLWQQMDHHSAEEEGEYKEYHEHSLDRKEYLDHCTFTPVINHKSRTMDQSGTQQKASGGGGGGGGGFGKTKMPRHDLLYLKGKMKLKKKNMLIDKKKKELLADCTFSPKVNKRKKGKKGKKGSSGRSSERSGGGGGGGGGSSNSPSERAGNRMYERWQHSAKKMLSSPTRKRGGGGSSSGGGSSGGGSSGGGGGTKDFRVKSYQTSEELAVMAW
jgi:hypothetical protein